MPAPSSRPFCASSIIGTGSYMPEKVLKSFDKATSVVGGLGNNIER